MIEDETFAFKCHKCHQLCPVSEGLQCFNCKNNSNTGAGIHESFNTAQPEMAVPRATGVAMASRNHQDPTIMPPDSRILVQNEKRNKTSDQIATDKIQPNTQSKPEIYKISDGNSDFTQAENTSRIGMTSGYSHSDNIREAFLKNESQWNIGRFLVGHKRDTAPVNTDFMNNESDWNIGHYQGSQKSDEPVHETLFNKEYQWNIGQFQDSQTEKAQVNTEFFNNVCQLITGQYQGTQMDNAPIEKSFLKNESQWNSDQFLGSDKDVDTVKSADSNEYVGVGEHFVDSILSVSGPSGFHENQNVTKVLAEKFNSSILSKIQSVVPRRIIKCLYCGEGIDKHTKIEKKETEYHCCVCGYTINQGFNRLQKHIRIHCSENECNACSKKYTEGTLHVSQKICQLCSVTFHCKTHFEEHLLELHVEHFKENCWDCFEPVISHYTIKEGKKLFFCCICGLESYNITNIKTHNAVHRPGNFCKICKEEYKDKEKVFHNTKYFCFNCKKEFKCRNQLEDHHHEDLSCVKHFSQNCILCNGIINKHKEEKYYKCCNCLYEIKSRSKFQIHLRTHTDLTIFKCDICRKRFKQETELNKHAKKCKSSRVVLCEICRGRFPSEEYLTKHRLEKHGQTT